MEPITDQVKRNLDLIRQYKSDINIASYLASLGYEADRAHYSRNWPVMINETTNHRVIIGKSKSDGSFIYYNPEDDKDKGSIIDFMAKHQGYNLSERDDWKRLHQTLGELVGNAGYTQNDHIRPRTIQSHTRESAVAQYFKLDPLTQTDFLEHDRKLTLQTIFSPEFERKIFNKDYVDKTFETAGKNTTFPVENENGITGVINRNTTWNQMQGSKDNSIWVSNILPGVQVKQLFITEAPIDAMSYHQLHPPKQAGEMLYVATAGNLSAGQPATIQYLIERTKPEQLLLGNDNDYPGIRFNINLMGKLMMPGQPNNGVHAYINATKHTNTYMLEINRQQAKEAGLEVDTAKIIARMDAVMNRGFEDKKQGAELNVLIDRPDLLQIKTTFSNVRPLLVRAENLTAELRGLQDRVVVKRAYANDWNEDVQQGENKRIVARQTGIKLTPDQLSEFMKTDRSPIVLNANHDAGKVVREFHRGGVTHEFVKRESELVIPATYRGVTITPDMKESLRTEGLVPSRVTVTNPVTNDAQIGYLGVDKELNTLVFLKNDRLRSHNLYEVKLTEAQTSAIIRGKTVLTAKTNKAQGGEDLVELKIVPQRGEIVLTVLEKNSSRATELKQKASLPTLAPKADRPRQVVPSPIPVPGPRTSPPGPPVSRPTNVTSQQTNNAPAKPVVIQNGAVMLPLRKTTVNRIDDPVAKPTSGEQRTGRSGPRR